MDMLLLGITLVSLIVALVMSVTAWRVLRDEKQRSAARIAALSAAVADETAPLLQPVVERPIEKPAMATEKPRAPWAPAPVGIDAIETAEPVESRPLRIAPQKPEPGISHASGFLGATVVERDSGSRQRPLAIAAVALFLVLSSGIAWMMSEPEGTSAVAVGPNSPLELVSLSHARQNEKLAVSGLVRNPATGKPVERLSAVVFLFDRVGTFVTSAKTHVDFLRLGAGDETPFVVSIDAPPTVARYRVSFRTDEGVVPHVDRRGESPAPAAGEQPINVSAR